MKKTMNYFIFFIVIMLLFNGEVNAEEFYFCNSESINAFRVIGNVLVVIKIAVPIIIIILGMIDFTRAIMSNDEKAIQVSSKALLRRVIAGVIVFFVPSIVFAILNQLGSSEYSYEELTNGVYGNCTKCLFNPSVCDELAKDLKPSTAKK